MSLPAHVAIVGGTRGTGAVIAALLPDRGARVTVLGRTEPAAVGAAYVPVDLCDAASVDRAAATLLAGSLPPTGLVFAQRYRGESDAWGGELEASVSATRRLIEALAPAMEGGGAIVLVTSVADQLVAEEQPVGYHAAKGAMRQMVRYWAVTLGPRGIRVNGVAPSSILKPEHEARHRADIELVDLYRRIVPLGRIGTAREVASAVAFLLSDDASFVTGQILAVDGGVVDGIREVLAPDGVFVFEVSYLVDIVDKLLFDTVYHEHLCYHSIAPFVRFFRAHGMELFDVERIASKGGSIRGFAQRAGGPRKVTPIVGELLALETSRGMARQETFHALSEQLEGVKRELLNLLDAARAVGRRVTGFGASATVTTLMHHFELGPRLEFLVDDNPRKHGTVSPGYHLPAYPSQALLERRVDDCVVLAWNYAPMIMERQKSFLGAGGRFVIPMPRVEVRQTVSADAS